MMMRKKVFDPKVAQHQAMLLFWQKGYSQTSMDELLNTIGISRSSFYSTFGDKRQLFKQVIEEFAELGNMACSVLRTDKPAKDSLLDFFTMTFFGHGMPTEQGCLLVNTVLEQQSHDEDLAVYASDFLANIQIEIANCLERAKGRGELKKELDTEHAARFIIMTIKGLRVTAKEGETKENLKRLFDSALTILD